MNTNRLESLDDATLRRDLHRVIERERPHEAEVIEHVAEFDARRLFLAEAFPSMFAYCVGELRLSEDAAYRRIRAGRLARRFPRLLGDIAEGRLHLAAVCLLAPHLTAENAGELVAAATHRSKAEIESWLASRFAPAAPAAPAPRARVTRVVPLKAKPVAPGGTPAEVCNRLVPGRVDLPLAPAEERVEPAAGQPAPVVGPEAMLFVAHIPMREATREKLRRAQDLLAHAVPPGDLGEVLDRALEVLLERLEARKHAAVKRPRPARAVTPRSRAIPAAVRRAVWVRDEGRCTFTSSSGRRCDARRGLEYDHVVPFARGGEPTVEGVRLRCHAHNQYGAEQDFGVEFMRGKRERSTVKTMKAGIAP
jgi:hypothetical protein